MSISNRSEVLCTLEDLEELGDIFMCEALKAVKECIGEHSRYRNDVASSQTLYNIEESRVARLAGDSKLYGTHERLEPF